MKEMKVSDCRFICHANCYMSSVILDTRSKVISEATNGGSNEIPLNRNLELEANKPDLGAVGQQLMATHNIPKNAKLLVLLLPTHWRQQ